MADRPTQPITTPGGRTVIMRTYITARESLPIVGDEKKSAADKANGLANVLIVSIDGVSEGIIDILLDMPLPEYGFVLAKVKEIADGTFQSVK